MKAFRLLFLACAALLTFATAGPAQTATAGPIQIVTQPSATTFGQTSLTLSAGQTITVDANGNPVAYTLPTVPSWRAGTSTATLAALTRTVTFGTPMPNTNYAIAITPSAGIGALQLTYSNKTVAGFTINFSLSTAAAFDWSALAATQ